MALSTVSVTVGTADTCLQLSNCSAMRELDVGTSWTELIILVGLCIDPATADPTSGSRFCVGVGNGAAWDAASGKTFAGYCTKTVQTWTPTGTSYYTVSTDCAVKNDTAESFHGGNVSTVIHQQSRLTSLGLWNGFGLHIVKASAATITINRLPPIADASLAAGANYGLSKCILAAETGNISSAASAIGSGGHISFPAIAGLSSGERGALNGVTMHWNRASSLFKVGHIVVGKWA